MQTCGADPRGGRVEWRDGGRGTRLVKVTALSQMMGTDPNLALSVLEGLGRWEAGRSAWGMDSRRKGWGRLQNRAGETSSSSTSSGGRTPPPPPQGPQTPPPRPPRKNPAIDTSRVATKRRPPLQGQQGKPKAKAKPKGKGKGKATHPPPKPQAPALQDRGRDPYGNVPVVGDTRYVPWAEGGNGGTVGQVTVLGDWDEELDPGEW